MRAQAKAVRSSARKARVVLEKIRGKRVADATAILTFSPRAVSRDIELVLRSAVSNAEANHGLAAEDLVIATATADEGVTMKRWSPRARGRAMRIRKRTTHITVTLKPADGTAATRTGTTRRRAASSAPVTPAPTTSGTTEAVAGLGATAVAPATATEEHATSDDAPVEITDTGTTEAAAGLGAVTLTEAGPETPGGTTPEASSETSADAPAEGADDQAAAAPTETTSTDQPAEGDRETVDADLDDDTTTTTNES